MSEPGKLNVAPGQQLQAHLHILGEWLESGASPYTPAGTLTFLHSLHKVLAAAEKREAELRERLERVREYVEREPGVRNDDAADIIDIIDSPSEGTDTPERAYRRDHAARFPDMHAPNCDGDPEKCHACKAMTIKLAFPSRLEASVERHKDILDRLADTPEDQQGGNG